MVPATVVAPTLDGAVEPAVSVLVVPAVVAVTGATVAGAAVSALPATFAAAVVLATVVAPTLAGADVPFVNALVVTPVDAAVASAVPTAPTSIPPPSAPLTIAGVGAELIDEFTVDCRFTESEGF